MSQPIRYGLADADLGRIHPQADGHLVMWADYAAIAAENERLKAETVKQIEAALPPVEAYIAKLEAENERLRKAGDAMMEVLESEIPFTAMNAVNGWLAAKEGAAK